MLSELHAVSHKYPPYAGGGLAPYMERSLDCLSRCFSNLHITLYTMNYPIDHPRKKRIRGNLVVVRPSFPWLIRRKFLNAGRSLDTSGKLWFGAGLALFNLQVAVRLVLVRARSRKKRVLISVHDWQSAPVGLFVAVVLRLPIFYHIHNTELTMTEAGKGRDPLGVISVFQAQLGRRATKVVVPTEEVKKLLESRGWDPKKIAVVPHGFEMPEYSRYIAQSNEAREEHGRLLRRRLGIPANSPVIVFAGRLSKTKGVLTLIQALPHILGAYPDARLIALGVGFPGTAESRETRDLVERLALSDRTVIYDRYLPAWDVLSHFDIADVCAFPSTYEPFGLVSVEAMSLARPVVLGSGFSDSIAFDASGPVAVRTKTDEPIELAQAITRLLDDHAAAMELARCGQRHVHASFTWNASTQKLWNVYSQAV